MKWKIYIIILFLFIFAGTAAAQQTNRQQSPPSPATMNCCYENGSTGLFNSPINTGERDAAEMSKPIYNITGGYMRYQAPEHQFKDHAPFIELDPRRNNDTKSERLWFTSSRYPIDPALGQKVTDKIMQIYFTERTISGNSCPNEGWSPAIQVLRTGDAEFDRAAKGAATIAGNIMIVSADYVSGNLRQEYNSLYELKWTGNSSAPYAYPRMIKEVSSDSTWETHPTLSRDGKHLFFASTRYAEGMGADINIFYSNFDGEKWSSPKLVKEISKKGSNEETPSVSPDGKYLYYSTNAGGNYDIYFTEIELNDDSYKIIGKPEAYDPKDGCNSSLYGINTSSDERYPFIYQNPENGLSEAILWASNKTGGWGNYDIYGCGYHVLELYIMDCQGNKIDKPAKIIFNEGSDAISISTKCDESYRYMIKKNSKYSVTAEFPEKESKYIPETQEICSYWYAAALKRNPVNTITMDTSFVILEPLQKKDRVILGKEKSREYQKTMEINGKTVDAKISETSKVIGQELDGETILVKKQIDQKIEWGDYCYEMSPDMCSDSCFTGKSLATSMKTLNGKLLIDNNYTDKIIRDTIYFTPCCRPDSTNIELIVDLVDICPECTTKSEAQKVIDPIIKLVKIENGRETPVTEVNSDRLTYTLQRDSDYKVYGGSNYCPGDDCKLCNSFIFKGYQSADNSRMNGIDDTQTKYCGDMNKEILCGANQHSYLSYKSGVISTKGLKADTTVNIIIKDKIYITKILEEKPPCECAFINLKGIDKKVPYFQTAFWEVNTSKNLGAVIDIDKLDFTDSSHLDRLTKGFSIIENNGKKTFQRSVTDYDVQRKGSKWGWLEKSLFPKTGTNNGAYDLANGRWIELHPNNQYWGVRDKFSDDLKDSRVDSYKERVKEYISYAATVDQNLDNMKEIILKKALPIFQKLQELSKNADTKFVIEIMAVSDEREVSRGWYIGDKPVRYNSGEISGSRFVQDMVDIPPPRVDLSAQKVYIDDETTNLGLKNKTLSDLRAWYGYQEVFNRIKDDPIFKEYLNNNKVYLPDADWDVSFEDAEIAITTCGIGRAQYYKKFINTGGRKEDGAWNIDEKSPYPAANNPGNSGYYDYDLVRSLVLKVSIINYKNGIIEPSECCDDSKTDCSKMVESDFAGNTLEIDLDQDAELSLKKLDAISNPKGYVLYFSSEKMTAQELKSALEANGFKNISVRKDYYSNKTSATDRIFIKYKTKEEAEKAKKDILQIIDSNNQLKELDIQIEWK